jgi:hypothetical protein
MARRVFYSFHYVPDCQRAAKVRNMGIIEGNRPATDNEWETIMRGGGAAIERWIDGQLNGKSCTVVLIGSLTAGRKWINYEIGKSWNSGKGVMGIYIHGLSNLAGYTSTKGANPFDTFTMDRDRSTRLSSIVRTYDPLGWDSAERYNYIRNNFAAWVEAAIAIRDNY